MKKFTILITLLVIMLIAGCNRNGHIREIDQDISHLEERIRDLERENTIRKQIYVSTCEASKMRDTVEVQITLDSVILVVPIINDEQRWEFLDSLDQSVSYWKFNILKCEAKLQDLYIKRAAYK